MSTATWVDVLCGAALSFLVFMYVRLAYNASDLEARLRHKARLLYELDERQGRSARRCKPRRRP